MSPSPTLAPPPLPCSGCHHASLFENVYEEPLKLGLDKERELTATKVKLRSEKIS